VVPASLTGQKLLDLLKRTGAAVPDLAILAEALDGAIEAAGAERGFLFRIRRGGGFRVLIARDSFGNRVADPEGRMSHHAVRKAMESGEAQAVCGARRDRRYGTEEGQRMGRQPASILVLPLRLAARAEAGVYLDHRFQSLREGTAARAVLDGWAALLALQLQARERERLLARSAPGGPPRRAGGIQAESMSNNRPAAVLRRPSGAEEGEAACRGRPSLPEGPSLPQELHGFFAASPDMLDLADTASLLGRSDLPVVISGETGTGKEVLAKAIHLASPRAAHPFLVVACGGMPDGLLESELFGHVRGAYTGAEQDRDGLLVQADGGTVLLDEVGDMSPALQQKLLRVLEDGQVRPLGGKAIRKVDVRIISSTQRNMEKLLDSGSFRKDLYYRLRGTVLVVPPLRERREEIIPLAERFLERAARAAGRQGPRLSEAARRRLCAYSWPGNVRELENECRRLSVLEEAVIEEAGLSPFLKGSGKASGRGAPVPGDLDLASAVQAVEKETVARALARSAGNRSRAAQLLGITRKALYRRIARFGL